MTVLLQLLFHEVVQPIIYGTGWVLTFIASAGTVRPTRARFYKYPLVALLGLLFLLTLPTLTAVVWREAPIMTSTIKPALPGAGMRRVMVDSSALRGHSVDRYSQVARWLVEIDDSGIPRREVGLNRDGNPLYRAPSDSERGLFVDSNVTLGADWDTPVTSDQFETVWARAPVAIR